MEPEATLAQRGPEALAILGRVPCVEGRRPDVRERHARPFLDEALLRGKGGHGAFEVEHACRLQPVGDVRASLLAQGLTDGPGVLARDRRQAVLVLDDAGDLLPPREVPTDVDDTLVPAHQGVDPMLVLPGVFDVDRAAVGLRA